MCSVRSYSLQPRGLGPTRLLCLWDCPCKNTGVGCHFLLDRIFPNQWLNSHVCWQMYSLTTSAPWEGHPVTPSLPVQLREVEDGGLGLRCPQRHRKWQKYVNLQSSREEMFSFPVITCKCLENWTCWKNNSRWRWVFAQKGGFLLQARGQADGLSGKFGPGVSVPRAPPCDWWGQWCPRWSLLRGSWSKLRNSHLTELLAGYISSNMYRFKSKTSWPAQCSSGNWRESKRAPWGAKYLQRRPWLSRVHILPRLCPDRPGDQEQRRQRGTP